MVFTVVLLSTMPSIATRKRFLFGALFPDPLKRLGLALSLIRRLFLRLNAMSKRPLSRTHDAKFDFCIMNDRVWWKADRRLSGASQG